MSASDNEMSIEVVEVVEADRQAIILEFLDALDPDVLERAALTALSWGGDHTVTAGVIEQMRKVARGDFS